LTRGEKQIVQEAQVIDLFLTLPAFTHLDQPGRLEISGPCANFWRGGCVVVPRASIVGRRNAIGFSPKKSHSFKGTEEKHAWPLKKK
jgi:hypothetical protein